MKKSRKILSNDEAVELSKKYLAMDAVLPTDDLTVVIRAHLLIEYALDTLLSEHLRTEKIYEHPNFSFSLKLDLVESMKLTSEDTFPAIRQLNKIRNDFAHDIGSTFSNVNLSEILNLHKRLKSPSDLNGVEGDTRTKIIFSQAIDYLFGYLMGYHTGKKLGNIAAIQKWIEQITSDKDKDKN